MCRHASTELNEVEDKKVISNRESKKEEKEEKISEFEVWFIDFHRINLYNIE